MFLYIVGPGSSGKSVFAHIISSLLPLEDVIATRLKDLNQDKFEVLNLANKLLVIINDLEEYVGDLSVLKAFVGQDVLKGSAKYVQGTFKVYPSGLLVVLANQGLSSHKDSGGALSRRTCYFIADTVSTSRNALIIPNPNGYTGILADERAGILNWVMA